jgi:hypothetical protein
MSPTSVKLLAEYFIIPLLVLVIAYVISGQFSLKYSAGTDFFIFFLSADVGALIEADDLHTRMNPLFREDYSAVFCVLLLLSVLFVIVSGLTQRRIESWREERHKQTSWKYDKTNRYAVKYPLVGVIGNWVAMVALMPTHLYVFFGKG